MSTIRKNTAATTATLASAIVALTAFAATACTLPSASDVKTTADKPNPAVSVSEPSLSASGSAPKHSATSFASAATRPAKVGDSITLTGQKDEKITVTLVKVVDKTTSTNEFITPDEGKHYAAVQFRIANAGTVPFSDMPAGDAKVLDAAGQSFDPDFTPTTASPAMATSVNIAPGDSQLGYITFQVADGSPIAKVQFTLDFGFGSTAQWAVR